MKTILILLITFSIQSIFAENLLEETLSYDVLLLVNYNDGKLSVARVFKGEIDKKITDRMNVITKTSFSKKTILFKFWKDGSKEFGFNVIDSKNRFCTLTKDDKMVCVTLDALVDALKK